MLNWKKITAIIIRCLIGFGVLVYLSKKLDISHILAAIYNADVRYLLIGLILITFLRFLRASQLTDALRLHHVHLSMIQAFLINQVAGFYNLFMPGEFGGGAVKWHRISVKNRKRAEVFATILFLRLVNTSFMLFSGILAVLVENPFRAENVSWVVMIFLGLAVIVFALFFNTGVVEKLKNNIDRVSARIPELIANAIRKILASLFQFRNMSKQQAARIFVVPAIAQLLTIAIFFFTALALQLRVPIVTLIWISSLIYFIQLIPVTFSGLGLREGALVFLLPHYGVDPAKALAFSLIIFGFHVMLSLTGGLAEAKWILLDPLRRICSAK
jgi:uncharacterized protein (TIRG00374 family)